MKLRFLIISCLLLNYLSSFLAMGSDSLEHAEEPDILFPREYVHKNVQQQISDYDIVYAEGVTVDQPHVENLFPIIIAKAFAYTYQHLVHQKEYVHRQSAIDEMNRLFAQVRQINDRHELHASYLFRVASRLAKIVDCGNNNIAVSLAPLETTKGSLRNVLPVLIFSNPDYKHKQTFIGYSTIVDQYLGHSTPRWVYQFEPNFVNITGGKRIKSMPHYAKNNTVVLFLDHEHIHNLNHICGKEEGKNLVQLLPDINNVRKSLDKKSNDFKVLTNALFFLIHESKISTTHYWGDGPFDYLSNTGALISNTVGKARDIEYKQDYRDQEDLLKSRNDQGQKISLRDDEGPLLRDDQNNDLLAPDAEGKTAFSKLPSEKKQQAVREAHIRFWEYLVDILSRNNFQEM